MTEQPVAALNPWRSIWLKPRATIRQIVTTNPEHHVVALAAAAGVIQALINSVDRNLGDELGLVPILLTSFLIAPILGVISLYLSAFLLRWTGRWLGGVATPRELRASVAWGGAPMVMGGVGMLVALLVAGHDLFSTVQPWLARHPTLMLVAGLGMIIQGLAAFWSVITAIKCLAEVQGFSAWRALGNYVLVVLVVAAVAFVVVFGVLLMAGK